MQTTDRYKNLFIAGLIISLIAFVILEFNNCIGEKTIHPLPADSVSVWKSMINKERFEKDSLIKLSKKKDYVRIETVVKYRWLKGKIDTIPCEEILPQIVNVCDSIIYLDSTQIVILKQVIKKDSSIINDYRKIVVNDSTQIVDLSKQIRKQKRQKKAVLIGAAALIGVAIIR